MATAVAVGQPHPTSLSPQLLSTPGHSSRWEGRGPRPHTRLGALPWGAADPGPSPSLGEQLGMARATRGHYRPHPISNSYPTPTHHQQSPPRGSSQSGTSGDSPSPSTPLPPGPRTPQKDAVGMLQGQWHQLEPPHPPTHCRAQPRRCHRAGRGAAPAGTKPPAPLGRDCAAPGGR